MKKYNESYLGERIEFETGLLSGVLSLGTFLLLSLGIAILFAIKDVPSVDAKVMIILCSLVFVYLALLSWFNIKITNDIVYYKRYLLLWKNRTIPKNEVQGMRCFKKEKTLLDVLGILWTIDYYYCEVYNNEGDMVFKFSNYGFYEYNKTASLLEKIVTDNGGFIIKAD